MGTENSVGPHEGESQMPDVHSSSLELLPSLSLFCCERNRMQTSSAQDVCMRQGDCLILVKVFISVKQFWIPNLD